MANQLELATLIAKAAAAKRMGAPDPFSFADPASSGGFSGALRNALRAAHNPGINPYSTAPVGPSRGDMAKSDARVTETPYISEDQTEQEYLQSVRDVANVEVPEKGSGMTQKGAMVAFGLGLLLNMIDSKRQAGGALAQGYMRAASEKAENEYQNALQKAEKVKQQNIAKMKALEIQLARETKDRETKLDLIEKLAERELKRKDVAGARAWEREKLGIEHLNRMKELEAEQSGKERLEELKQAGRMPKTVEDAWRKLTDPDTDPKDKPFALMTVNQWWVTQVDPFGQPRLPLRPENINLDPSYKVKGVEAKTTAQEIINKNLAEREKTELEILKKKLGFMDSEHLAKLARGTASHRVNKSLEGKDPEVDAVFRRQLENSIEDNLDAKNTINATITTLKAKADTMVNLDAKGKVIGWKKGYGYDTTVRMPNGDEYTYMQMVEMIKALKAQRNVHDAAIVRARTRLGRPASGGTSGGEWKRDPATGLEYR